jgi:hypothetical protein
MKGAGYYDQHSSAQLASMQGLQDWLDDAVAKLPLPTPPLPVTVLDLGSSEGGNAIQVIATIVAQLRRRTDQPIQTIYSDLASNNFNQLFANMEAAQRRGHLTPAVYPSVVGGSFYGPLLPPGSVHFATCFNSINWLDRLPAVALRDGVTYRRPSPSRPGRAPSPAVTAAFTRQAERDLVRFLECRAAELVPGGKLLVATPGDTEDVFVSDGLADVLNDAYLDLVATGLLKREELERFTMPVYFRTVAELLAPLRQAGSPVCGAFTVDRAEALEVPAPFIVELQRSGDVAAYARSYTGFIRAITEPVVQAALNQSEHATQTIDHLYARIQARLQAEPVRYLFRYILVAALLTRC